MKPSMKGALLLVPILVLGGLSLLHEYNRSNGTTWTVAISGYDPRDLLRGHYLMFQYDWNLDPNAALVCSGPDCALCTSDPAPFNPRVSFVPRADAPALCASFIAGTVSDVNQFYISGARDNLTRYYVPETEGLRLQGLLLARDSSAPNFSVGLRVTDKGIAYIEALYVDGIPLETWLRNN